MGARKKATLKMFLGTALLALCHAMQIVSEKETVQNGGDWVFYTIIAIAAAALVMGGVLCYMGLAALVKAWLNQRRSDLLHDGIPYVPTGGPMLNTDPNKLCKDRLSRRRLWRRAGLTVATVALIGAVALFKTSLF